MTNINEIVAIGAARTPLGKFGGVLRDVPACDLGAHAIRSSLERAGLKPDAIDRTIMGQCRQTGNGSNPARTAALTAGLPIQAPAETINMACSSGMRAIQLAAQSLATGESEIVVAGGMDSMSTIPFLIKGARWGGWRLGDGKMIDGWTDGADPTLGKSLGEVAEDLAARHKLSREAMDACALRSHQLAVKAQNDGLFDAEIAPFTLPARGRRPEIVVRADESVRADVSPKKLSALPPVFRADGLITAGNACPMSDGAVALVLTTRKNAERLGAQILFSLVSFSACGVEPHLMLEGPAKAIPAALTRAGLSLRDVDLFEINEAFAAKTLICRKLMGIDEERLNVLGGAIALGHPVGASGARVVLTLCSALKSRGGGLGVAALGGAGGVTTAIVIRV